VQQILDSHQTKPQPRTHNCLCTGSLGELGPRGACSTGHWVAGSDVLSSEGRGEIFRGQVVLGIRGGRGAAIQPREGRIEWRLWGQMKLSYLSCHMNEEA
jgi:hypothetical protein